MEFRAVSGIVISLLASEYMILFHSYRTWTFGERNTVNTGLFLFVFIIIISITTTTTVIIISSSRKVDGIVCTSCSFRVMSRPSD